MVPYEVYKVMHLVGLIFIFLSLGGMSLHIMNGGSRDFKNRRWIGFAHGIGMLLTLVAGFGLIARIYSGQAWPMWIYVKIGIWFIFGLMPVLIYRQPQLSRMLWLLMLFIGGFAAFLAIYKPF